jgi:RNA polymerase sigma-70 factor (ECF subfamily)
LYFSAYRIVKNQEDALDAVQEGFINAFEKLDQFNETGSFEGWLRNQKITSPLEQDQECVSVIILQLLKCHFLSFHF